MRNPVLVIENEKVRKRERQRQGGKRRERESGENINPCAISVVRSAIITITHHVQTSYHAHEYTISPLRQ